MANRMRTILLAILLLAPSLLGATELRSEFGFTAQVPDGWLVLSRDELRQNSDLFEDLFSGPELASVDRATVRQVEELIRTGKAELLFREDADAAFASNINIIKQIGRLPDEDEISVFCRVVGAQLQKVAGRPIEIFACRIAEDLPIHAVYLEFEGMLPQTRSLQYLIRKSENVHVVATATAADASIGGIRGDFDSIVASLRFE